MYRKEVSRDVGMRTKITGTACDVSSSRLALGWYGCMGVYGCVWVYGYGDVSTEVSCEWLAGTGPAGWRVWQTGWLAGLWRAGLADTMLQ